MFVNNHHHISSMILLRMKRTFITIIIMGHMVTLCSNIFTILTIYDFSIVQQMKHICYY